MDSLTRFIENFRTAPVAREMAAMQVVPWALAAGYVLFVFAGQAVMRNRSPIGLKPLFILWNLLLATFSIVGGSVTITHLLKLLNDKGERYVFCTSGTQTFYEGPAGFWMLAFILSKIPELVDTIFLVLQKKPVIFLHWYHHTTVMLYCWYAIIYPNGAGLAFGAMNYFVHSIMYSYYFMMSLSGFTRSLVRPFAQLITLLQLAQMVVGLYITVRTQLYLDAPHEKPCNADWWINISGLVMYASYFLLFFQFFWKNYISKTGKKRGPEAKKIQ